MRKLLFSALLVISCYVYTSFACTCVDFPDFTLEQKVQDALKHADAVFIGKASRFDYINGVPNDFLQMRLASVPGLTWETKTVVFDVDQFWKGLDGRDVSIVTDTTRNSDGTSSTSSCEYPFEEGKTYLVFARIDGPYLRNNACSFTRRDDQTKEILPLLGDGKKPKTNTPAGSRRSDG